MPSLSLPFSGAPVIPPEASFYIALANAGRFDIHGPRPRVVADAKGYDCNDYAYDAVQTLKAEGRTPYYVAATDELGQGHMFAAYPTDDGTIYARDNRMPQDVPLQWLAGRGYKFLSSSDPSALIWNGFGSITAPSP